MKQFKNIFLGAIAGSTIAISLGICASQSYAQSESYTQSEKSATDSEILANSEVRGIPNWDYPAERGPWPKKLGLTDEQMSQLVLLKSQYSISIAKQEAELKADIKKMILLMTESKLDKSAILSLNEKIEVLKASLYDARVNQMLNAMNVMTPEQREQIRHHMLVHTLSHHSMGSKSQKGSSHHHHDPA